MYIYIYISSGLRPDPATALSLRILFAIERLKRRSVGDPVVFLFWGGRYVFSWIVRFCVISDFHSGIISHGFP